MTEPNELKPLMAQVAELLEHFRRQSESIREANMATAHKLGHAVNAMPSAMQQAAQGAIDPVAQQIARQVSQQITGPLERFNREVIEIHNRLIGDMHTHQQTTRRLQLTARWAAVIAVVLALTMAALLTAFVWQARQAKAEAARYAVDAAWGRALAEADMVPCEGRVCVKVDATSRRGAGDNGYVPVRRREEATVP